MKRNDMDYDVIVVGGGHAGAEASLASARLGMSTLLITLDKNSIVRMSCNPAIGGLAKGNLVTEIDALGGEMGKVIDKTGLQFRVLNRSKGRAVWSLRAQADKITYPAEMTRVMINQQNLEILEDCAISTITENGKIRGIKTEKHGEILCKALILTCGTFLNGLIHIGLEHFPGGRLGERDAKGLTESLNKIGIYSGRLKTGTPPRILKSSINFDKTKPQYGDDDPIPFSFQTTDFQPKNIPCFITHTNPSTHEILSGSLDRSPLFTGVIKGIGPRYCPSIEDKIFRFRDKDSHQIFLEPEWEGSDEYYVNGFSTSLPLDVQIRGLHTIPGLEDAEVIRPGYAIEYDFFPSCQLYRTLETKRVEGLYIAGQINGVSGYEEASALGLMAGINAALKIRGEEPIILKRSDAYIGVLIDDLITKSPEEPYRMFTSSSEHRLILRFDNADQRLSPIGEKIGLLPKGIADNAREKSGIIRDILNFMRNSYLPPNEANYILTKVGDANTKSSISMAKLLSRPSVHFSDIEHLLPEELNSRANRFPRLLDQVEVEVKYEGYIKRQYELIELLKRHEDTKIPKDIDYSKINSIRKEAREKLSKIRPESLGQASRIDGVTPADISSLMIILKNRL